MDRPRVLDTVELTCEVSGVLPAGTIGTIVTEYPASALVEIVGSPEGDLLDDLISVPYDALKRALADEESSETGPPTDS